MSAPKPPRALVEKLLADGPRGVLTSSLCLAAARAVRRGGSAELSGIESDQPVSDAQKARIREAHAWLVDQYRKASAQELDCAIALFEAHLREAGYLVSEGGDN